MIVSKDPASFRDPCGFVFRDEDCTLYRQINRCYEANYRALIDGGLYDQLVEQELLIEHDEVSTSKAMTDDALVVIRPREVPFISYPYEWSFSALKQAALLTLEIQRQALRANMSLKDASSYNVQFEGTRPVFIDTLSFERYEPGTPWVAYGQFCRHFLAPLTLMSRIDISLNRLLANYIDGIPLDLASGLLPWTTWLKPGNDDACSPTSDDGQTLQPPIAQPWRRQAYTYAAGLATRFVSVNRQPRKSHTPAPLARRQSLDGLL